MHGPLHQPVQDLGVFDGYLRRTLRRVTVILRAAARRAFGAERRLRPVVLRLAPRRAELRRVPARRPPPVVFFRSASSKWLVSNLLRKVLTASLTCLLPERT
jgi:hypothetical protein